MAYLHPSIERFSREHMVLMDRRAIEVMAEVHPERDLVAKMRSELVRRAKKIAPPMEMTELDRAVLEEQERRARIDKALERALFLDPPEERTAYPDIDVALSIMRQMAIKHVVSINDLKSESRAPGLVHARHEAMFLIARETGMSFPRIGNLFRRDHTTVLNAIRAHWRRSGMKEAGVPLPRGLPENKPKSRKAA